MFFSEPPGSYWWARFFRPGFKHVSAASWFDLEQRWVYFNPARPGTTILVIRSEEFGPLLAQLQASSRAILRVRSEQNRFRTPAAWFCVGALKALLGIRSRAFSPYGLYRDLVRRGAEPVPCVEEPEE